MLGLRPKELIKSVRTTWKRCLHFGTYVVCVGQPHLRHQSQPLDLRPYRNEQLRLDSATMLAETLQRIIGMGTSPEVA